MQWYRVDDKDISASTEMFVFRLRQDHELIKNKHSKDESVKTMKLQVRKKQNVDFRDLGYKFLISSNIFTNEADYVDSKVWTDIEEIAERAEDILLGLGYIEYSEDVSKFITEDILRSAAKGFIKAFMNKNLLKALHKFEEATLESMIVRGLIFWGNKEIIGNEVVGLERDIRLKELEAEISVLMSEPDMYFIGGWPEIFESQKYLHDEHWLVDSNEEDESEKNEYLEKNSRMRYFCSDFFHIREETTFVNFISRSGLDYWVTDDGRYKIGNENSSISEFIKEYKEIYKMDFIKELQMNLLESSVATIYSVMLFTPKQKDDISSIPSISISGELHLITREEHHHTTLENAAKLQYTQKKL